MKKKIIIQGRNVHRVAYRPFLLRKARELGIQNYDAKNVKEEYCLDKVVVSLCSEEKQVQEFFEFAQINNPKNEMFGDVREGEPPEHVMSIDEYDKVLAAEQRETMVQTGVKMLGKQDELKAEARSLLEQMTQQQKEFTDAINGLTRAILALSKKKT